MVRLPDSNVDWEEHTHTSGRIFLSNPVTNETRWLWQKWDMKGRLFVRNIADPTQQLWIDQMDLPMRLKSGTASQDEIAHYIAYPPPPPPPPSDPPHPQHPPQHHWHTPPRSDPHFDRPPHHFRSHHSSRQNGFEQLPPHAFHHDINPQPQPHGSDPYFANRAPDNRDYRPHHLSKPYPTGFDNRQIYQSPRHTPHPANASHVTNHHPLHPSNRDPLSLHPSQQPPQPSASAPLYTINPSQPDHLNRHHSDDAVQNHTHNPEIRSNYLSKNKKRSYNLEANAHARYWNHEQKQGKKRSRTAASSDNSSKSSRFAPLPKSSRPRSPRSAPRPPDTAPLSGDSYGSFRPSSTAAQLILSNSTVREVLTVGLLYDRDFRKSIADNPSSPSSGYIATNGCDEEYTFEAVIGTCEEIEKDYLRLTSAPKPEAVRPPEVLTESLAHIKSRWQAGAAEYDWVCRQLKSVRQDYKVQHIADKHVVDVYETHARIALENKDLGEFNTCVAQVQELYRILDCPQHVQDEFACYRIIYNVLVRSSQWEQGKILGRLTNVERDRPATRFALKIRHAIATGNYRHYFMLCSDPPQKTMVYHLLEHLHDRVRFRAASVMTMAYGSGHPGLIPLRYVLNQMGWDDDCQARESTRVVPVETVVPSEVSEIIERIRALEIGVSTQRQARWVYEALAFLLGANVALTSHPGQEESLIDQLDVDFKTTKVQGLRERKITSKLITHAGSEDVMLMK